MKIALGTTAWLRGLQSGHLDGHGYYTQELFERLRAMPACDQLMPVGFGISGAQLQGLAIEHLPAYSRAALASAIWGVHFKGAQNVEAGADLFHATDDLIPKLRNIPVLATLHDAVPISHPQWVSPGFRGVKK